MYSAHFHSNVRDYLERARGFLLQDRVFNMHQLRISTRSVEQVSKGDAGDVLWGITVETSCEVVAAAMFTKRHALFVSPHAAAATSALVAAIPKEVSILDVVGQSDAAWSVARAVGEYELFIEGSLYALRDAPRAVQTTVQSVQADQSHIQTIVDWNIAFIAELKMKEPLADVAKHAKYRVDNGQYFLAYDGGVPVGMAGGTYVGDGIGSIGPVYTVPAHRGSGQKIGQAVTAFACNHLRAAGASTIVLMADQTNPVSNAAYQKIGFVNQGQFHHLQQVGQPKR